jgi:hypothetical protein
VRSLALPLGTRPRSERYSAMSASDLQARARAFVDEILIPREVDAELGRLGADDIALIHREALATLVALTIAAPAHATLVYERGLASTSVWAAADDGSGAHRLVAGSQPHVSRDGQTGATSPPRPAR